jgi:site-specific DNA recombinase
MSERKLFRCAVYTRKSSEEGLEQDFNSLEAQREACEAYVRSQAHEGWTLLPERFDDGGFSGGNMQRPAVRQLMERIEAGAVDIIVVYKIDRLTRSLTDFARLAEVLERKGVSFVSVTQQFNTTTSMGRLMLNVLLSFAQFEREITGERIRDKIAASKKKGMWMGGNPPMGYDIRDRQLVVNDQDATTIRRIFELYLEEGTVPALLERLDREEIRTASRFSAKGNHSGNRPFTRGHLYKLLSNPIYIGRVPHKALSHRGQHPAIIDRPLWDAVQAQLALNTQGPRTRRRRASPETHLLDGLLHAETGARFTPSSARKGTRRYRYYVEQKEPPSEAASLPPTRLPAAEIEAAVVTGIQSVLSEHRGLLHQLDAGGATEAPVVIQAAGDLLRQLTGRLDTQLRGRLRQMLSKVIVGHNRLQLLFSTGGVRAALGLPNPTRIWPANQPEDSTFAITVPLASARRGRQTRLVLPGAAAPSHPDPSLITAIVRAWDWAERLKTGSVQSITEICATEGFTDTYVGQVLPLAFLSPQLVEAILAGQQPAGLTANRLIWGGRVAMRWDEQIRV